MTRRNPLYSQTLNTGSSQSARSQNQNSNQVRQQAAPFTEEQAKKVAVMLGHIPSTDPAPAKPPAEPTNEDVEDQDELINQYLPVDNDSLMHETAFDHFAKQCQGWEYAEKQKRLQMIWDGLAGNLTATYLHCQHRSMNWTQGEAVQVWRHDIKANAPWPEVPCTCSSVETRKVDLIDLLANDVRNSTLWDRCDDIGLFGSACRHDVLLKLINIYKSGEKLHYPVTILDHLLHDLPEKKVGVLYEIGCHLKAHIEKRQLLAQHEGRLLFSTSVFHAYAHQWRCQIFFNPRFIRLFGLSDGEGLERLCNRFKVRFKSKRVSTELANFTNPSYPESTCNNNFFSENIAQHEMKLALARLLCLQEELDNFWKTPGVQLSPEQTLARTQSQQKLEASIAEQRQKIGKQDVRVKYLALCPEKRPLEDRRVPGKKSKLGTHGKTALLTAVRKHAVKLYQAIKLYNDRLSQFNTWYPDHPFSSPPIVYKELFTMEADDEFWNNGLFTNANEPWAVNPHTQQGMRQFAYFERSEEEIRRIGWEVRLTMRWASSRYRTLFNNLEMQGKLFNDERHACLVVDRILAHPNLQIFPSRCNRRGVASNLFYNDFLEHVDLMETWNDDLLKAFRHTAPQGDPGDKGNVWGMWKQHIIEIETMRHKGFLTTQLGSFRHYFWDDNREYHIGDDFDDNVNPPFYYSPEDKYVEDNDNDEEDQWIKTLDDEVLRFTIASAETKLYLNDLYE
ncbi:hypothetical protein DFH28DRAFT_1092470 [Melampsora americana]|nr:hypothetical protein DFH28DRAFT_1092470 [Melampsora americana]